MVNSVAQALDQLLGVVAGGLLTVVTASLLGRTSLGALPGLRGKLTIAEGWILSFAVGSALLSTLIFALCAMGWVSDPTMLVLAGVTAACWLRWGRWRWSPASPFSDRWRRSHLLLLLIPAVPYGLLYLVHVLAPETRTDAMGYHLGLVQRYYRANGFVPITTNIYAQISQGAEMLYLLAYSVGRESAAKVVHFGFLVATSGAILTLASRFRAPTAGVFAAVVFVTCPVVIPDAASAYNDCALAFALLMVFYVLALWRAHGGAEWLTIMGLLIGFCFAIKYTGVIAVWASIVPVVTILSRGQKWRRAIGALALIASTAASIGLPWLAKSALVTGNPLAPFFNSWFRNQFFSVEWEKAYSFAMQSYRSGPFDRWEQLLSAPFDLVIGERYGGSMGWMLLLAPVALLAVRRQFGRALLLASFVCALPWFLNAGARFLIPSMLFGVLALGLVLQDVGRRVRLPLVATLLAIQCLTSWPAFRGSWYHPGLWSVEGFPLRAALRLEPEKWHLARNVRFFLLADHIDRIAASDTRVLSFFNLPEAYFSAELLVSFQGLENQDLADALLASTDSKQHPDQVLRVSWPLTDLLGVRVRQESPRGTGNWAVSELRLLAHRGRTDWPAGLVATAFPHPWHASRLVDRSVLPLWNSREPVSTDMWVEASFSDPVPTDGLELVFPKSSSGAHVGLAFSGWIPGSGWTDLVPTFQTLLHRPTPLDEVRRAVSDMLRRHRIGYVVLNLDPRDPYYDQARIIASNPVAWGLQRIFVDRTAMLFEVD